MNLPKILINMSGVKFLSIQKLSNILNPELKGRKHIKLSYFLVKIFAKNTHTVMENFADTADTIKSDNVVLFKITHLPKLCAKKLTLFTHFHLLKVHIVVLKISSVKTE